MPTLAMPLPVALPYDHSWFRANKLSTWFIGDPGRIWTCDPQIRNLNFKNASVSLQPPIPVTWRGCSPFLCHYPTLGDTSFGTRVALAYAGDSRDVARW